MTSTKSISQAAAALGRVSSPAKTTAARQNGQLGGRPAKGPYEPTYHRDGSVTYWSVYRQVWERSRRVSDEELAARDSSERERIIRHTSP